MAEIAVKAPFRLLAIPGAVAATAVVVVLATWGAEALMHWIEHLSPLGLSILRTACLTAPTVGLPFVLVLVLGRRRGRDAAASDDERDAQ